jgi:hypothetical protein
MLSANEFQNRCRSLGSFESDQELDATAMIGFFQRFRPDGQGLDGLFDDHPHGDQLQRRLDRVFAATGNDRREGGGRDAYFIVRDPPPISAELTEHHGQMWLESLRQIAARLDSKSIVSWLDPLPRIRVLEGSPPKQPKGDLDTFPLLRVIKVDVTELTNQLAMDCHVVSLLRDAYYYIACDSMLRDYLLWPAYSEALGTEDLLASYFELWRHGVKLRVFHDDMIDLYIPRRSSMNELPA